MTRNRDVFQVDPTTTTIPNDGVAKVLEPRTSEEWEVLRYELTHFVCEGEYRRGLQLILDTYLANLNRLEQPAVWVSGFYGSGKSHFVRVLEYLWRDVILPDGVSARGQTTLPQEIRDALKELSTAGKREGGLWSAAGTLSAGAGKSVRLALLGILFRSAGLPDQYAPARFVIWLRQNGYYDAVKAGVETSGKDFAKELNNMYVSPVLAGSLLAVYPEFASSSAEARSLLKAQYSNRDDISDEELLLTLEDVLSMQSSVPGKLPYTLLVFDELQQFIGDDSGRTLQVQTIVEACSSRFGSRLLFVATGQAALQSTPQLSKLQGRFTVRVTLSDNDVERVVREVVLRKRDDKKSALRKVLDDTSGEINRHLLGTKIGPRPEDAQDLVPDYPLLPVRRRFWERVLRAIDSAGTAGQLRTQLRIVHDAARDVADKPVGSVVAGDFIYDQLKPDMLQSSVLLRDVDVAITNQSKEGPDGPLRARLCALVFLIGKLPTEGVAATGVRATASTLADLLVEDLPAGSAALRQRIPAVLEDLADSGILMLVGDEYRLQTRESAEWEGDFRSRYARIQADDSRIASDRATELRNVINETLKGITFTQGVNKTPRKYDLHFGADLPTIETGAVPVWIRDEWSVSERTVREDAQREGTESPIVFVFLPRQNADDLKAALAGQAAAKETLEARPRSTVPEAIEARSAMEARHRAESSKVKILAARVVNAARVYQGGGIEVNEGNLQASVRAAIDAALVRLFPEFHVTDVPGWGRVVSRAGEGAADALAAIGYHDDVDKHPACKQIRDFIGSTGKRGSDIRKRFMGPRYGWPQDAVDGVLLALVAGGFVRATRNGQPINIKGIVQSQIGVIDFFSEGVTISAVQRIQVRKLITDIGLPHKPGEEAAAIAVVLLRLSELAEAAGGDSPLPERPDTTALEQLQTLSGNEQFAAVYERREELRQNYSAWSRARTLIEQRLPRWRALERFLGYTLALPVAAEVMPQVEAIRTERTLLTDPDPVTPLVNKVTAALRRRLSDARDQVYDERQREVALLQSSLEWQSLAEADQQSILAANDLNTPLMLNFSTEEELLQILAANQLADWENKLAALPARIARAREEAARRLAPQAVRVQPAHATLKTAAELDDYLAQFRDEVMAHLNAGRPVII